MEATCCSEVSVFAQSLHGVTSQKNTIIVKTSKLNKITLTTVPHFLFIVHIIPDSNPKAKSKITARKPSTRSAVVRLLCDGTNSCEGEVKRKQTSRVSDAVTNHSNVQTSYQHRMVYQTYILLREYGLAHSSHMRELSSALVTSHSDLDLSLVCSHAIHRHSE